MTTTTTTPPITSLHPTKKNVVIGLLGSVVDSGFGPNRWQRWRPTISLCQHPNLCVDRFELLSQSKYADLAQHVITDIQTASPTTTVKNHLVEFSDPWDFQEVYASLLDFARAYPFNTDSENYLIHITTGTHVAQICLFLLTEAHYFPAQLIQTAPPNARTTSKTQPGTAGSFSIIDLDLSKYDKIASRFREEQTESLSFLKSGIDTRNAKFNALIEQIEKVAISSKAPLLLMGPTGAGKSQLARKLFELKKSRRQLSSPTSKNPSNSRSASPSTTGGGGGGGGAFIEVNCATIRGDSAMSALFGHTKGAFTGALSSRPGLLRAADGGILFLDEIGELGPDEQAMLLRALEEKRFLPVGSDTESQSDFQLIAGTNKDLAIEVDAGRFREDLFARINLWTFRLPGLKDRREDIEPNIEYELNQFARLNGHQVTFNKEARQRFLQFATSSAAEWRRNFRDLNGSIQRLATLAPGARIPLELVEAEIQHLQLSWRSTHSSGADSLLPRFLKQKQIDALDRFDRVQLEDVLSVCLASRTLSDAGRTLFAASRQTKKAPNDADRLRKYLARFNLDWSDIHHNHP